MNPVCPYDTHTDIAIHCLVTGVFVSVKPIKSSVLTPREHNVSHHNSAPMRLHKIVSYILSTRSDQHISEVYHRHDIRKHHNLTLLIYRPE